MARKNGADNVVVCIDKDKGSQYALKWAVDNLLTKGQSLTLLHVKLKPSSIPTPLGTQVSISDVNEEVAKAQELFLPFRCFCTRKDVKCNEVLIEDTDIAKGIIDFVTSNTIEILILGAPSRGGLVRKFKTVDIPSTVSKGVPDFCMVYIIAKGKISAVRPAVVPPPAKLSLQNQLQNSANNVSDPSDSHFRHNQVYRARDRSSQPNRTPNEDYEIKSPFNRRGRASLGKSCETTTLDTDISFVSSGRPSTERTFPSLSDNLDPGRLSNASEYDYRSFGSNYSSGNKSIDISLQHHFSSSSDDGSRTPWSSNNLEEVEAQMRRLRLELKQTMDLYSSACKEALTAKQKARELHLWKLEEEQKLEEARLAEEAALTLVEKEKAKCKAAIEAAEAAQRIAELEAQKRINAELRAQKEIEEQKKEIDSVQGDLRYRKYSIEEIEEATDDFSESLKIGEGGYGPVYKGYLDHTPVAIKILRPDAAQGRAQFQQEVEVLSCIRHPNMVLLLGACPEYGCLVYEYMANGSLDDCLFRRGKNPPLPWQVRFRIAAEIGTALLFLHQTKPEPLVHRDLKPGNILLDRNYVSKISDVGLARLVPPSVTNSVTQYRMTATAGTFCYIDPEYQQTGMLGIKSDIYSLGIMFLQIITAKPPMGLTHHVERAIEKGTFAEILDPAVPDWPVQDALRFAELALQCAELRRKDRPDLGKVILPELNRLREVAEGNMPHFMMPSSSTSSSPNQSLTSASQDVVSDRQSEYDSSRSRSSTSSHGGGRR